MKGSALTSRCALRDRGFPLKERRAHRRMGFVGRVRWNLGGVDRNGCARDVSEYDAGFTVRALNAPAVNERVRLIFELSPDHEWVVDECAVVKRCDRDENHLCHVGVQFSTIQMD